MTQEQRYHENLELVIITGMSGAGRTVAMQSFEDLGYYCIDNLPPELLSTFLDLMLKSGKKMRGVAAVMDTRGGDLFDSLIDAINYLKSTDGISLKILFLDADDDTLVRRYKESRRSHPLAEGGLPLKGIQKEREILQELRGLSRHIYDTSNLKPRALRERIVKEFSTTQDTLFTVNFVSFGFKHGMPIDADVVFDVRFLPNPYYIEKMRPLTGLDEEVANYVFKWPGTHTFNEKLLDLFRFLIPQYKIEGKSQTVIAIGCTGGQHRSVALSEYYANQLRDEYEVHITHRDLSKKEVR